jgi:hypothetical protein
MFFSYAVMAVLSEIIKDQFYGESYLKKIKLNFYQFNLIKSKIYNRLEMFYHILLLNILNLF